jgi:hypothetical protein
LGSWLQNPRLARPAPTLCKVTLPKRKRGARQCGRIHRTSQFLWEPTSGTYTTMEFTVPRNVEINSTQEPNVNPAVNNPLDISYASGVTRERVVGTGEMVSTVGAMTDSIGYAFWSTTNFAKVTSTTTYLTVDGADPLFPIYTGGTFPTCTAPCPGLIPFTNVLNLARVTWDPASSTRTYSRATTCRSLNRISSIPCGNCRRLDLPFADGKQSGP